MADYLANPKVYGDLDRYGWTTDEEEDYDPKGKEGTSSDEEEAPLPQPGCTHVEFKKSSLPDQRKVYIMIFSRPEGVPCTKTESGRRTRWPQALTARPGGGPTPCRLVASWRTFRTTSNFVFFQIFQNGENFLLEKFWTLFSYRITYLFVFGV